MPKIYSQELRVKIIEEYFAGGISQRNLAKKHGVGISWLHKLVKTEKRRRIKEERRSQRHLHIVRIDSNPNS